MVLAGAGCAVVYVAMTSSSSSSSGAARQGGAGGRALERWRQAAATFESRQACSAAGIAALAEAAACELQEAREAAQTCLWFSGAAHRPKATV